MMKAFAEQVLSSDLGISESEELLTVTRRYLEIRSLDVRSQKQSLQKTSQGVPPVQSFPNNMSFFMSDYHMGMELFEK